MHVISHAQQQATNYVVSVEARKVAASARMLVAILCLALSVSGQNVDSTHSQSGTCSPSDESGAPSVYVSFIMVGRVDTLRGDYVGRLRNSVQFIQGLSEVHGVRSEVSAGPTTYALYVFCAGKYVPVVDCNV